MEDFDIPQDRFSDSARKLLARAVMEARRLNHSELRGDHIFLVFAHTEWNLYAEIMRDLKLNPRSILKRVDEFLDKIPKSDGRSFKISSAIKLTLKIADHEATRSGHEKIESLNIFSAIFEDSGGTPALVMKENGLDDLEVQCRIEDKITNIDFINENLKKVYELPPFLKHFATNLNLLARQEKIPPVFNRDEEIRQATEILCHRDRPNSVMLIGEAGVGKTAIAEGLARMIEFEPEKIPARLRDCQIVNLQLNSLVAGTMLRGMFEERMQNVIRELKDYPKLILFIDEAHSLIGSGSALGAPTDAANILKSSMARGETRIIAATTMGEYKQFIQEDEALSRRFRPVFISEPTLEVARNILFQRREGLEKNYGVKILDEAIDVAIDMSPRYMRHLRLPDKVIGWLDTASVRAEINKALEVGIDDVVGVIADTARIPNNMVYREVGSQFNGMAEKLSQRVVGQKEAISSVVNRLVMNKGPLKDGFDRPDGVLLFLGPTGVGKTELAKALAEFLFGDDKKMIRIDMSEYQDEKIGVDKLIGMPRGIVGSEGGGILTNQLRDNPYTVILLDEVEKAHPLLLNVFLQAFDEGWLTDGRGKRVYLSDSIVIMTSNLGSQHIRQFTNPMGFRKGRVGIDNIKTDIMKDVEHRFPPEFTNRIDDVVIFSPLSEDEVREIATKYIGKIESALREKKKSLIVDRDAMDKIGEIGYSLKYGARGLKRVIDDKVKMPISQQMDSATVFHVMLRDGNILVEANGFDIKANSPLALA